MTNEIGENFMYYDTTKEIWDAVKETYSNIDNTSAIFEIKSLLHDLQQGEKSVTEFSNTLSRYWQRLDTYDEIEWKCPDDKKKYREMVGKDRIYKFLWGLIGTLMKYVEEYLELPKLREVFSEVRREESRRKFMLGNIAPTPYIENSALAARGNQTRPPQKKNSPWCYHCRKLGHTK